MSAAQTIAHDYRASSMKVDYYAFIGQKQETTMNELEQACHAWQAAKEAEGQAKAQREAAAQRILELAPPTNQEGSEKKEVGAFKITVSASLTRTVDDEALSTIQMKGVPRDVLEKCFKWKPVLDLTAFRVFTQGTPYAQLLQSAVIAKPAKPSIKVEMA